MTTDTPEIGHNSGNMIAIVESDPKVIYRDAEALDLLVSEIEQEIAKQTVDVTTEKGRKAVKSFAATITSKKTSIEKAGLELTEGWRKQTTKVNQTKKLAKDKLENLQKLARDPVTQWEKAEEDRKFIVEQAFELFKNIINRSPTYTEAHVAEELKELDRIKITEDVFGKSFNLANADKEEAYKALGNAVIRLAKEKADAAELEQLREERAMTQAKEVVAENLTDIPPTMEPPIYAKAPTIAPQVSTRSNQSSREQLIEAMTQAKEAIMEAGSIDEPSAKKIVTAIYKNSIPQLTLNIF